MRTPGSWMKHLAFASAVAVSLCSAAVHAQGTPQRGGTLVMVVQPEPPTLASYQSTAGPIGQVSTKVYEGLLEYDFNLKPVPGLAQWNVGSIDEDGIRYGFATSAWKTSTNPMATAIVRTQSAMCRQGSGRRRSRGTPTANEDSPRRRQSCWASQSPATRM